MIQHLCLIRYKEPLDEATKQKIVDAYRQLPDLIPGIRSFRVGSDLGLLDGNADLGISAEFDTEEDFQAYSVHKAHEEVIFPVLGHLMQSYETAQIRIE